MVSSKVKTALDFLPLIVFLVVFKWLGIFYATGCLMVVTIIVSAISFVLERRVATMPLVLAIVVAVSGGLTLWFQDERFLKMKPTVVNLLFASTLFVGCLRGKGLLHYIMGAALQLTDRGWWLLSRRFGFFFTAMAVANELVWRTMPTDWWVNFKVFGLLGCTLLFTMLQVNFIQKHLKPEETNTNI